MAHASLHQPLRECIKCNACPMQSLPLVSFLFFIWLIIPPSLSSFCLVLLDACKHVSPKPPLLFPISSPKLKPCHPSLSLFFSLTKPTPPNHHTYSHLTQTLPLLLNPSPSMHDHVIMWACTSPKPLPFSLTSYHP